MKKILLFLFVFNNIIARAQSFEGTVTWSVKYEIADPAKKAEMEKNQKSLSDPANQAKIKQLQDQMNTPQMKSLMDANPQMKATMEKNLKMLQGADPTASVMPTSMIIKTKGSNSISTMDGGMMATETLYQGDKKQGYILNRSAKTFTKLHQDSTMARRPDTLQHKVTKTSETMKILNYNCTKYIVTIITRGDTINQIFWTTTDATGLDMRSLSKQKMGNSGQPMFYDGISGVPLRIE
ncbi:MAG: hypothetical protein ABJB86_06825, partial [Bacteroidota bacterium]